MKKPLNPLLLGLIFTILIFLIHGFFSYFINDTNIIRILRPIRDFLFFPLIVISDNIFEIYCSTAKVGLFDYQKCITSTGPGLNMPDGPPVWFESIAVITSVVVLVLYYGVIFKIIQKVSKKFQSSPNKV